MKVLRKLLDSAINKGDLDYIKEYVEKSGNVNFKFSSGDTLMIHAIRCKKNEIVKYLISKGADPLISNVDYNFGGESPLEIAIEVGNFEAIKILIEDGKVDTKEDGPELAEYLCSFFIRKCKSVDANETKESDEAKENLAIYEKMHDYIANH